MARQNQNQINNVFTSDELNYLNNLPEVIQAKERLDSSGKVYFKIPLTASVRSVLAEKLGLDLTGVSEIPMRWIKGDTAPHIDIGASQFENTYLVYLSDSPGDFVLGDESYPITQNTGYVFNEGLLHKTEATGNEGRLLLGPMNEFAEPVGLTVTFYYPTEADAIANTNLITGYGNYTIFSVSGYNYWRIASTSTGPSPQNVVYKVGDVLSGNNTTDFYYLYPSAPCFLEGTKVLCQVGSTETYVPVEEMRNGTLVKTSRDGFKKVVVIAKGELKNPGDNQRTENRLYKLSPSNYPDLKEDLFITGCHSILEFPITEKQKEDSIKHLGKMYITDNKYRLMAHIDERAEPWNSEGTYTIYHFALDNADDGMNYGVYANGGLLVETCAIRTLKNRTNMTIL
jgi:hypothetical protein